MVNIVLDHSGALAYYWLLCLQYVCFVLNNCHLDNIGCTPLRAATGQTNDISPLLWYAFCKAVYYKDETAPFPSGSKEQRGYWVGVSEHIGSTMMFKILMDDTLKVIHQSHIHTAADPASKNKHIDPLDIDADVPLIIKSAIEQGICNSFSPLLNHGETEAHKYPEPTS